MAPIERAIAQTQRFIERLDAKTKRAAWGASVATSAAWRERWLMTLGVAAQRRENALYLLNGLKAIRYRPELGTRRPMLKAVIRRQDARRRA